MKHIQDLEVMRPEAHELMKEEVKSEFSSHIDSLL